MEGLVKHTSSYSISYVFMSARIQFWWSTARLPSCPVSSSVGTPSLPSFQACITTSFFPAGMCTSPLNDCVLRRPALKVANSHAIIIAHLHILPCSLGVLPGTDDGCPANCISTLP